MASAIRRSIISLSAIQGNTNVRSHCMKRLRINLLLAVLTTLLIGCASNPPAHDENARIQSQTKVTKDQISAEGQRKIPVTEQY